MTNYIISPMGSAEQAVNLLFSNLASSAKSGADFLKSAYIENIKTLYLPCYAVRGRYDANWTASFGFDRTVHYTDYVKIPVDGGRSRTEARTRTKTVTDWRIGSGRHVGTFEILVYAGFENKAAATLLDSAFWSDINFVRSMESDSLCENNFSEESGCVKRNESRIGSIITSAVKRNRQGDHQKGWNVSYDYEYSAGKAFYPVFVADLVYKSKRQKIYISTGRPFKSSSIDRYPEPDPLIINYDKKLFWGFYAIALAIAFYFRSYNLYTLFVLISFYIFHKYALNSIESNIRKTNKSIVDQRSKSTGFIGLRALNSNLQGIRDGFWRSKLGLASYSAFIVTGFLVILISPNFYPEESVVLKADEPDAVEGGGSDMVATAPQKEASQVDMLGGLVDPDSGEAPVEGSPENSTFENEADSENLAQNKINTTQCNDDSSPYPDYTQLYTKWQSVSYGDDLAAERRHFEILTDYIRKYSEHCVMQGMLEEVNQARDLRNRERASE